MFYFDYLSNAFCFTSLFFKNNYYLIIFFIMCVCVCVCRLVEMCVCDSALMDGVCSAQETLESVCVFLLHCCDTACIPAVTVSLTHTHTHTHTHTLTHTHTHTHTELYRYTHECVCVGCVRACLVSSGAAALPLGSVASVFSVSRSHDLLLQEAR